MLLAVAENVAQDVAQDVSFRAMADNLLVLVILLATVICWLGVGARRFIGRPLLAYEPRRPVPWDGGDLAIVVLLFLLGHVLAGEVVHRGLGLSPPAKNRADASAGESSDAQDEEQGKQPDTNQNQEQEEDQDEAAHFILRLAKVGGPGGLLIAALSVVVVAPLVEEMLFRLFLQGWMEKVGRRLRTVGRHITNTPGKRAVGGIRWPRGAGPIALSSALFGLVHLRVATPTPEVEYLLALAGMISANAVVGLLTIALACALFRARHQVSWADLGLVGKKVLGDVRLGLITLGVVFVPLMALQAVLTLYVFPEWLPADPVPMVFLGATLGWLYYRTHRIVPCIVLHAGFNGINLLLAVLAG